MPILVQSSLDRMEIHGDPWRSHGDPMEIPWRSHGDQWRPHGDPMSAADQCSAAHGSANGSTVVWSSVEGCRKRGPAARSSPLASGETFRLSGDRWRPHGGPTVTLW
eukprot:gene16399-biopygen1639